jgi:hypothetical protein
MDEVEKCVPSRFSVGFEADYGVEKSLAYPVGESVLHGFVKPVRAFTKGKLDGPLFLRGLGEWGCDFPIGVIQRHSKGVDCIASDNGRTVYDGFVLFGERGALAGLCVCFEDVRKGAMFAEQFVKLSDAFRSPINT